MSTIKKPLKSGYAAFDTLIEAAPEHPYTEPPPWEKPKEQAKQTAPRKKATTEYDSRPYWEKLKDPRWQRRRLEIMERDNFKCRHCRSDSNTLNVHHRVYNKGAQPWDYDDHLLITLCESCHESAEKARASVASLMGANRIMDKDMVCIAEALSSDPDHLTFLGWAVGEIAMAINLQKRVFDKRELNTEDDDCCEFKEAVNNAVEHLYTALFHFRKNYQVETMTL